MFRGAAPHTCNVALTSDFVCMPRLPYFHLSALLLLTGCAAGITREQLDVLLSGSGRVRMRQWLEGLGPVERSVFVMRAVLGRNGAESTELLQQATGDPWTETHVGGAYRAALCSLASSLVHSTAH